jgi:hypothetical protein
MKKLMTWVVYERLIKGLPTGSNSVCEQREWDEMEQQRPGDNILVKSEFSNEGEAERFARSRSDLATAARPTTKPPRRPIIAPVATAEPMAESTVESVVSPL